MKQLDALFQRAIVDFELQVMDWYFPITGDVTIPFGIHLRRYPSLVSNWHCTEYVIDGDTRKMVLTGATGNNITATSVVYSLDDGSFMDAYRTMFRSHRDAVVSGLRTQTSDLKNRIAENVRDGGAISMGMVDSMEVCGVHNTIYNLAIALDEIIDKANIRTARNSCNRINETIAKAIAQYTEILNKVRTVDIRPILAACEKLTVSPVNSNKSAPPIKWEL